MKKSILLTLLIPCLALGAEAHPNAGNGETNSWYIKSNTVKATKTAETIKGYTMNDLCNMLGAEFLVSGVVTLNRSSSTTTGGGSATSTTKKSDNKDKTTTYVSGTSSSYDNYTTTILMNVYDHGEKVFTKSHQAFWPGIDAYKVTLSYLAKKTPIYEK